MDKIENRVSFDHIRYANCWEDADMLCVALRPGSGMRMLSIASAGDNSLSLLSKGAEVIAVDISPAQLACVELRVSAIRNLDYDSCLGFLGVSQFSDRLSVYAKLRGELSRRSASFWDANSNLVEKGFMHCGKFERYLHVFRNRVIPLIYSDETVGRLLEEKTLEERIRFYDEKWDNLRWRLLFKVFFSRFVMGWMGRDPEFFRYVETPVSAGILECTKYALTQLSTHDNPYLDYILTGNYTNCLPHYLRPENFEAVKNSLDKLHLFEGTVQDAAKSHGDEGFDGFNLSDIFEYLDLATCRAIYGELLSRSRDGARFAYWNMLATRRLSDDFSRVEYLKDISGDLFARGKAFFYKDFIVEEKKITQGKCIEVD